MSDDDPRDDVDDDPAEDVVEDVPDDEEESTDSDDQPDLEDDETVDLDAIAEEIEDAEDEETADVDSGDAEDPEDDEPELATADSTPTPSASSDRSWGRMYTKGVTSLSEAIVGEFGDEGAEPVSEQQVRDMELDEAFNEWFTAKTGRPEDLSAGQWVGIGTVMLIGTNAAAETDLAKTMVSEVSEGV